jgi:hypothetical protein
MAAKKIVKKAASKKVASKKVVSKKGDEPVRVGHAPAKPRTKMDNYKQGYKAQHPYGKLSRTQFDYAGEDESGGVYETEGPSGFGKTKSYYRMDTRGQPVEYKKYAFPITHEAVLSKKAKRLAAEKKKKK